MTRAGVVTGSLRINLVRVMVPDIMNNLKMKFTASTCRSLISALLLLILILTVARVENNVTEKIKF